MLFYFTGTGNSLQAAQSLQEGTQEELVDIGAAVCSGKFTYEISSRENVGFVFPVYFWGLPVIVTSFIEKLRLTGAAPEYIYAVITCGSSIAGADQMLRKKLKEAGYGLNAVFPLKMPDNYVLLLNAPTEEEQCTLLEAAQKELAQIRQSIRSRSTDGYSSGVKEKLFSAIAYSFYLRGRKTAKFCTDDRCVGCGACARRCPWNAIEMKEGKPVWIKERCIHCLGCINRCSAIQYGKKTENRRRYVNPVFRKKKPHH